MANNLTIYCSLLLNKPAIGEAVILKPVQMRFLDALKNTSLIRKVMA